MTHEFSAGAVPYLWVRLPRHHSRRSTNIRAWVACSACNQHYLHGGYHSSCCLSKSKTKNKRAKKILSKSSSFFRTNCPCSSKRTGHCAWPCCSFSWSDCTCNHPPFCMTCCSLSLYYPGNNTRGIACLNDNVIVSVALMIVTILVATCCW
jgi:hypothetical protein